jgi:hypothetical protein
MYDRAGDEYQYGSDVCQSKRLPPDGKSQKGGCRD